MPRENVEVVRALHEAIGKLDLETMLEQLDPAVEWHENPRVGFSDLRPVYRGHEGFRTWWEQIREPWEVIRAEVQELTDAGSEHVLCAYKLQARGRGSEVPVISPTVYDVFTVRAGKVVERRLYSGRDQALEATGLGE